MDRKLELLKKLHGKGVEFEMSHTQPLRKSRELIFDGFVTFKGGINVYRIPSIEYVEGKIVEMDKVIDTDFIFECSFSERLNKWNYLMANTQVVFADSQNTNRLTAALELWWKLIENKGE